VPVETLENRKISVRLEDKTTGDVLQSEIVQDTSALVLLTAFAIAIIYTTEKEAAIVAGSGSRKRRLSK